MLNRKMYRNKFGPLDGEDHIFDILLIRKSNSKPYAKGTILWWVHTKISVKKMEFNGGT